jgi:hypothetical protein
VTQTLQKRKIAAKWVPLQLSEKQKAARNRVAELLRRYEAEGEQFLNRIVAIDEPWIRDFESQLNLRPLNGSMQLLLARKKSPPTIESDAHDDYGL